MSIIPRIFASVQAFVPTLISRPGVSAMHSACNAAVPAMQAGGAWSAMTTRNVIRIHFPRAREGKRVKTHGWAKRMSTPEGRRVIMRRILKGRHALTH